MSRSILSCRVLPLLLALCWLPTTPLRAQMEQQMKYRALAQLRGVPAMVAAAEYAEALAILNPFIPQLQAWAADDPAMQQVLIQSYYLQGISFIELEQYGEATTAFQNFLVLAPNHANASKARLLLAEAFLYQEQWESITRVVPEVIQSPLTPHNEREMGHQLLARAFFEMEKWEEAIPSYQFLFQNSRDQDLRNHAASQMAVSLIRLLRFEDLYRFMPRLFQTEAKYDLALNLRILEEGDRFVGDGRPDLALLMYRMVVSYEEVVRKLEAREKQIADAMREIEEMQVKPDAARQRYRQLQWHQEQLAGQRTTLEQYPDYDLELRVRLGDVYNELERWEEAVQLYMSIYEIAPESEIAERAVFAAYMSSFQAQNEVRAWEIAQRYMKLYPGGEFWEDVTLHAASLLISLERWFEVTEVVEEALKITPAHAAADNLLYMKGYAQFQLSQIREAIATLRRMLADHPQTSLVINAEYWIALGHLFLEEYPEARAGFMAIVDRDRGGPLKEDAFFRQAVAEYGLGDFPLASQTFRSFLESYPNSALASEALAMQGDIEAAAGNLDEALTLYRDAVDRGVNPVQVDYAVFQQARVYELEKRWQEILELFDDYLNRFGELANFTQATYWKGNAMRQLGRQEESLRLFYRSIVQHGNDPKAFGVDFMIRDLVAELSNLPVDSPLVLEIREQLSDALVTAAAEDQKSLRLRLQGLQYETSRNEDLRNSLREELLKSANLPHASPGVLALMGRLGQETRRPELTREIYEYFLKTYESSDLILDALVGLSEVRIQEERYAEARDLLRTLTDRFPMLPQAAQAYLRLGDVQRLLGDIPGALDTYSLVLTVKEWRGELWPTALLRLGDTHAERGSPREAFGFYQRVYVMYRAYAPQAAEAYYKSAIALEALKETEQAKNTLREMLDQPELARQAIAQEARALLMRLP